MKKTAGFLRILMTIAMVLVLIALIGLIIGAVIVFLNRNPEQLMQAGITIDMNGIPITAEELAAFLPILLFVFGLTGLILLIALIGIIKLRIVLGECKAGTPFSEVCCRNLKGAARLELLSGIIGVAGTIVLFVIAKDLTFGGTPVLNTSLSLDLGFIVSAVALYLLWHVADYGRSLESRTVEE